MKCNIVFLEKEIVLQLFDTFWPTLFIKHRLPLLNETAKKLLNYGVL